jgi:hypothetical protein
LSLVKREITVLKMRKMIKWSLMAGLLLPLCGIAYSVSADDGQLSNWEDSSFLDYPPPPVGGWEPLVPIYNPDKETAETDKDNKQNTNADNQPAPAQSAPPAAPAYATPPAGPTYAAPVAPGYNVPVYNRGYIRPGYNPGFNRPAYPAAGFVRPGFNRGYNAPAYNMPGAAALPVNNGNPWNDGHPGGWAATPWGAPGPAGWVYPVVNDATTNAQNGASTSNPVNAATSNLGGMAGGFNAPTTSVPASSGQINNPASNISVPVRGFDWNVH